MSKHKFIVRFYQPAASMKFDENHERYLYRASANDVTYRTLAQARRRSGRESFGIAGRTDEHKRRVVEIRIWDE